MRAVPAGLVETLRPLLPVGYASVAEAYRQAAVGVTARELTTHYTEGVAFFQGTFVPYLKDLLRRLSGGEWDLQEYAAFAAGSDVDLISHVVNGVAAYGQVALFPGDWGGFAAGCVSREHIRWQQESRGVVACLCVPSVRNGHLTEGMVDFLTDADACLLNLNLFPTLQSEERRDVAHRLRDILPKTVLSISFSRGFGLTASQLGVLLIHPDHPWVRQFRAQWTWFTYFYNAIAARAFMQVHLTRLREVDEQRRRWVTAWLRERGLPVVESGSYYVKAFRVEGALPDHLKSLVRDDVVRLCLKPPQT